MHSVLYRVNAILTFAIMVLAIICTLASFSERLHSPQPDIQLDVSHLHTFSFSMS